MPPRYIFTSAPFGGGFFWCRIGIMSKKRTLIAIHGAGMQADVWGALSKEIPCLPLSLPGHGKAVGHLLPSIGEMARWLEGQMKDYPLQSVVLMGHSMGALVAMEAAKHWAVAGLVLMGAAAQLPVHADLLKQAAETPEAAAEMILKWGISSAHPQAAEIRGSLRMHMQPMDLFNDLVACNSYHGTAAKAVQKPVLVLAGEDDKLVKFSESMALAEGFAHARFRSFPGAGHMLMLEKPVETAQETRNFMDNLKG